MDSEGRPFAAGSPAMADAFRVPFHAGAGVPGPAAPLSVPVPGARRDPARRPIQFPNSSAHDRSSWPGSNDEFVMSGLRLTSGRAKRGWVSDRIS